MLKTLELQNKINEIKNEISNKIEELKKEGYVITKQIRFEDGEIDLITNAKENMLSRHYIFFNNKIKNKNVKICDSASEMVDFIKKGGYIIKYDYPFELKIGFLKFKPENKSIEIRKMNLAELRYASEEDKDFIFKMQKECEIDINI